MRRADFFRREYANRRRETQVSKASQHGFKAEGEVPRDVLEKAPTQAGSEFPDDPFDVGPEVAFVVLSLALSGLTERLAGVSGKQGVDASGEGRRVEGGDVIPDWRGGEVSGPLGGNEGLPWVLFPFDKAAGVEAGFCEHEAHIEATGPGAEGKSVSGW
jgi:hypothetical protein